MTTTNSGPTRTLTPLAYEYAAGGEVKVTLLASDGELVRYMMSTSAMVEGINMAVALVNANLGRTLQDV